MKRDRGRSTKNSTEEKELGSKGNGEKRDPERRSQFQQPKNFGGLLIFAEFKTELQLFADYEVYSLAKFKLRLLMVG